MKKLLSLVIAGAMMCVALVGCGSDKPKDDMEIQSNFTGVISTIDSEKITVNQVVANVGNDLSDTIEVMTKEGSDFAVGDTVTIFYINHKDNQVESVLIKKEKNATTDGDNCMAIDGNFTGVIKSMEENKIVVSDITVNAGELSKSEVTVTLDAEYEFTPGDKVTVFFLNNKADDNVTAILVENA